MPDNWRDSLPDNIKDHTSLKDIQDVAGLADSFINAQALLGTSIRIPGADASSEALTEFHGKLMDKVPGLIPTPDPDNADAMNTLYARMGRPADATGYEHPQGVDASTMGEFAKVAHEAGLTKDQYKAVLESVAKFAADKEEGASEEFNKGIRQLKQQWGITYEDNIKLVGSVLNGTGAPDSMKELAAEGKLPADALQWLFNIGKQLGTEGVNFDENDQTTRLTPDEAKAQIDEIMGNREGPYWDVTHPSHKDYIKKVTDLHRAVAAGGAR